MCAAGGVVAVKVLFSVGVGLSVVSCVHALCAHLCIYESVCLCMHLCVFTCVNESIGNSERISPSS